MSCEAFLLDSQGEETDNVCGKPGAITCATCTWTLCAEHVDGTDAFVTYDYEEPPSADCLGCAITQYSEQRRGEHENYEAEAQRRAQCREEKRKTELNIERGYDDDGKFVLNCQSWNAYLRQMAAENAQ